MKTFHVLIGDINVIAALGDGTIAGKGALADNLADMNIEYKGVSFATGTILQATSRLMILDSFIHFDTFSFLKFQFHLYSLILGSDYNWRKKLTLPNILKEFNSRLKGASKGKYYICLV